MHRNLGSILDPWMAAWSRARLPRLANWDINQTLTLTYRRAVCYCQQPTLMECKVRTQAVSRGWSPKRPKDPMRNLMGMNHRR